jgi:glycosyltransferase involved in cell wall biosynthesis
MIAEAMAHSKPVVATRVGGIPELIIDGVSGFLVDRGDAELMSERVLDLLKDDQARTRMGQIASEIVQTKFDLQKNVMQLVQSYGITVSEARPLGRAVFKTLELRAPGAGVPAPELHPD